MISFQKKEQGLIRRYPIVGGRRLSNYWWSIILFLGGCGFLYTGISSFFNRNLLLIPSSSKIEPTIQLNKLNKNTSLSNFLSSSQERKPLSSSELKLTSLTEFDLSLNFPNNKTCNSKIIKLTSFPSSPGSFRENLFASLYIKWQEGRGTIQGVYASILPTISTWKLPYLNGIKQASYFPPLFQREKALQTLYPKGVRHAGYFFSDVKETSPLFFAGLKSIETSTDLNGIQILPFFPQGLVLCFYGFLGLCFSFHLGVTLFWKIGAGFNEINGKEKSVRIFRWGKPGKNRRIDLKYPNELINTIKIELNPKPALFLCVKGDKKIPLTRLGDFIPLEDLETQAAELTSLLQIPLEIEELST